MERFLKRACVVLALSGALPARAECPKTPVSLPSGSLSVGSTSFSIDDRPSARTVTTLGVLKSSMTGPVDGVVVEVRYFDAGHALVDSVTQLLYGLVVPPNGEASFRVRDEAAQPRPAYVSQEVRVLSAQTRPPCMPAAPRSDWMEFLMSWGPMILLAAAWFGLSVFFVSRRRSPQARSMAALERRNELLDEQNRLLERIAERMTPKSD